jgi:AraC-like DNA-binding protein
MDYLLLWRMLVARELMRSGNDKDGLALSDIARRVGYGCPATFIRAFRRHAGQTPGRFAKVASA